MDDGRNGQVRTFLRARIIYNNHMSTIDCVIRKLSEDGALVEIGGSLTLPDHFDLEIPIKGKRHACRLLSRGEEHVSLRFEGESSSGHDDLATEVRRLKTLVRTLSGRLRELGEEVDPHR